MSCRLTTSIPSIRVMSWKGNQRLSIILSQDFRRIESELRSLISRNWSFNLTTQPQLKELTTKRRFNLTWVNFNTSDPPIALKSSCQCFRKETATTKTLRSILIQSPATQSQKTLGTPYLSQTCQCTKESKNTSNWISLHIQSWPSTFRELTTLKWTTPFLIWPTKCQWGLKFAHHQPWKTNRASLKGLINWLWKLRLRNRGAIMKVHRRSDISKKYMF